MSQSASAERISSLTLLYAISLIQFKLNYLLEPITLHTGAKVGLSATKRSNQKLE